MKLQIWRICLFFLSLLMALTVTATDVVKRSPKMIGKQKVSKVDLRDAEIVEIAVKVNSPPYEASELATVKFDKTNDSAEIIYGGLKVQGGNIW